MKERPWYKVIFEFIFLSPIRQFTNPSLNHSVIKAISYRFSCIELRNSPPFRIEEKKRRSIQSKNTVPPKLTRRQIARYCTVAVAEWRCTDIRAWWRWSMQPVGSALESLAFLAASRCHRGAAKSHRVSFWSGVQGRRVVGAKNARSLGEDRTLMRRNLLLGQSLIAGRPRESRFSGKLSLSGKLFSREFCNVSRVARHCDVYRELHARAYTARVVVENCSEVLCGFCVFFPFSLLDRSFEATRYFCRQLGFFQRFLSIFRIVAFFSFLRFGGQSSANFSDDLVMF